MRNFLKCCEWNKTVEWMRTSLTSSVISDPWSQANGYVLISTAIETNNKSEVVTGLAEHFHCFWIISISVFSHFFPHMFLACSHLLRNGFSPCSSKHCLQERKKNMAADRACSDWAGGHTDSLSTILCFSQPPSQPLRNTHTSRNPALCKWSPCQSLSCTQVHSQPWQKACSNEALTHSALSRISSLCFGD